MWRYTVALMITSASLVWAWSFERGSVERANRLHREGRENDAVGIYQDLAQASGHVDSDVRYNLGTALVGRSIATSEDELTRAKGSPHRGIRARAHYNLGLSRLNRALNAASTDSARIHAEVSVAANRSALRLRPEDMNTKWNLAMGLRILDSIQAAARLIGREMEEGDATTDVVTRSVNVPDAAEDERAEDPPTEGEDEALAEVADNTPLTAEEADKILSTTHLNPTQIVTKLLALEGRWRWGRQRGRSPRRW